MSYSLREVYYYLVSFVMLILVVIGLFQLVGAGISLFEPDPGYYRFEPFAGEAEIKFRLESEYPEATEDEIARMVRDETKRNAEIERSQRNYWRWQRLANALAFLVIAFPIYRYHWRKVRDRA